jgi:hypothetical protein
MPVILNVTGPHQILWGTAGGAPSTALGRADNDDLFSIDIEYQYQDIFTNEFGMNPANAILMGARAYVSFTLGAYDPTEVANLFQRVDGDTSATGIVFPKVGALAGGFLAAFKVSPPAGSATPTYTVDRCRLVTHTLKDTGNKPTRAAFKFEILPGSAGATIFTTGTA